MRPLEKLARIVIARALAPKSCHAVGPPKADLFAVGESAYGMTVWHD
jgi:hypothetical protein